MSDFLPRHIGPNREEQMEMLAQRRDLGFNKKTGRVGILFAEELADFYVEMETADGLKIDARTGEVVSKLQPPC